MRALTLSVLVVADDRDYAHATATLLRLSGYHVAAARTGEDALFQAAEQAPDVVLLDLALPDVDGYELAERLRGLCAAKPPFVVAISAFGRDEGRVRPSKAGIDLYMVKPVAPAALLRVLGQFEVAADVSGRADAKRTVLPD